MLARAQFDQYAAARVALSHPALFGLAKRLPYRGLHHLLVGLTWLETWVRWPLKTLKMSDGLGETFSTIDPRGERFGLTPDVRRRFWRNRMYLELADLFVLLNRLDNAGFRKRALTVEGVENLLRERERGPGAIVLGFRLGVYPLIPLALGALGYDVSMVVGGEPLAEMGQRLGERFAPRAARRVRFLSAGDPLVLARCREQLSAGGLVSTLMELSPQRFAKTTPVQFLGWQVHVPYGVPYLAAATGRSIVPTLFVREAGPRFRLKFLEPVPPPTDRGSVLERTQQLYTLLEQQVRRHPEQWVGWTLLESHLGVDIAAGQPDAVAAR